MGVSSGGSGKSHVRYTCVFCERQFPCHRNYEEHMHIHTGEKPRPCSECDIWFKSLASLCAHKRVVHRGIKLACDFCGREFNDRSNLHAHKKRIHGHHKIEEGKNHFFAANPKKDRSWRGAGGKALTRKNNLQKAPVAKTRKDKISNIPKLECKIGGKSSIRKIGPSYQTAVVKKLAATRKVKQSQRKGDQAFKCQICGNLIAGDKFNLNRHVKRMHPKEAEPKEATKLLPHQIEDSAPFITFGGSRQEIYHHDNPPPFQLKLPFQLHTFFPPVSTDKTWNSSFFLHMNRYRREDSCFSDTPSSIREDITEPTIKLNFKVNLIDEHNKNRGAVLNKTSLVSTSTDKKKPFGVDKVTDSPMIEQGIKMKMSLQIMKIKRIEHVNGENENPSSEANKCTNCGISFTKKCNLGKHVKKKLCYAGVKQMSKISNHSLLYSCVFCKKEFGDMRGNLTRHIAGIHRYQEKQVGTYQQGGRRKFTDYSCAFCGLTTHLKETLQQHILMNHSNKLHVVLSGNSEVIIDEVIKSSMTPSQVKLEPVDIREHI